MLQDLREYLEENPDNAVAPEWSETVRSSVCIKDPVILHDSCDQITSLLIILILHWVDVIIIYS